MIARMSAPSADSVLARTAFDRALSIACDDVGLALNRDQAGLLWHHYELVLRTNRQINLTRITAPADAAVKHYADSLAIVPWARKLIPRAARVLDVGTGAGFPAVPLAVCCPEWQVLAVDGTRKKADFLSAAAAELGLGNLTAKHARAHELVGQVQPFDLVTCRAVGDVVSNARETRRLVAAGGSLACYTTPRALSRLMPAQQTQIGRMGFGPLETRVYHLILGEEIIEHALAIWPRR
jgi:16S rRNA (guanine527-N7)-methyltransferase